MEQKKRATNFFIIFFSGSNYHLVHVLAWVESILCHIRRAETTTTPKCRMRRIIFDNSKPFACKRTQYKVLHQSDYDLFEFEKKSKAKR